MNPSAVTVSPSHWKAQPETDSHAGFAWGLILGLFILLFFAVLAFGAVEPWSTATLEFGAAALFAAWLLRALYRGRMEVASNPLYAPVLLFALVVGIQVAFGLTTYRYATFTGALLLVCYGLLFFLTVQVMARPFHSRLVWLLIIFGFAVALFAILQDLTSNGMLYWVRRPRQQGWIYGPYVNHNHYAGLMEMLVPFALVTSMGRLAWGGRRALVAFAAVLMAASIFMSQSRGGSFAFLMEVMFLAGVLIATGHQRRGAAAILGFATLLAAFLFWAARAQVFHRYESFQDPMRLAMLQDGVRMFIRKPLLGWGLGAFPNAYPGFRSFYTEKFVNAAHNDYLQLLIETGLMGFAAAVWFIVALYRRALPALRDWDTEWSRAFRLAALMGCTGILVHSLVDFNLQIPANAACFAVLCAMASVRGKRRPEWAGGLEGSTARREQWNAAQVN
jgi:O-antigen ligase